MSNRGTNGKSAAVAFWMAAGSVLTVTPWVLAQQGTPPSPPPAAAGGGEAGKDEKPDFPPFAEVSKGYEKVVSTADGAASFYTIWKREKDGQMLAELPRNYEQVKQFFAMTVAGGELYAGLQAGDMYTYWKRYDKKLALIEPNTGTRSTGDQESKNSVNRLFTDRVLLDVPILCMGPSGQPVIDLDGLLLGNAQRFFGGSAGGANASLAKIVKAKAFPENVEVAYQMPVGGGVLKTFHYSISSIPDGGGYKPRVADERVGYFTTSYRDLGKMSDKDKWVRYVNRWNLEKADASLKLSPPKEPIVFYIDNTVPIRYRRFVRDGVLMWNKAFEKVGIKDAIEVYQQDATTGAHMDKDPEDVRYNFVRWLSNDIGTAIGPSRVHPLTGQILDADIVLTDGWIRHFWYQYNQLMPQVAMESMSPETLAWLETRPQYDPRVLMADPSRRNEMMAERMRAGAQRMGGHALAGADPTMMGDEEYDGLNSASQRNGLCMAATGKAFDMAVARLSFESLELMEPPAAPPGGEPAPSSDTLDGIPDWFIGPMLADLVAHECGHTLGLRHNFKASSIYSMAQVNSSDFKGKKAYGGSVMDYNPVNIRVDEGDTQGDYTMIDIGPYDFWVIEYGYTFDNDLKKVTARVAEPELVFGTDEDTVGSDPFARRYDFAADPIEFAKNQMKLAKLHRSKLLEKFVKDGESWANARRGYEITLGLQVRSLSMMSDWIGGAFVNRDRKGDPNGRSPVVVVDAARQRDALKWVIENAFRDESFGLTPEILARMTVDKWWDDGGDAMADAAWPIHDRIMGVQSSVLTMLMNPTTLRNVYDNEFRVPTGQDTVTLPEMLDAVTQSIWTELANAPAKTYTARDPMISSFRRNLQREHLERLIDLATSEQTFSAAYKPISTLSTVTLAQLKDRLASFDSNNSLDPYTRAHLLESKKRIESALDAKYVRNASGFGGGMMFFGAPTGLGAGGDPNGRGNGRWGGEQPGPQMGEPETLR